MTEDTPKKQDDTSFASIKETFESIIIAFILAFVFRAFVVEAFVIPTGSMAPTLLGQHISVTDPQSGYPFKIEAPKATDHNLRYWATNGMPSPMGASDISIANRYTEPGDRILVLKYVYPFSKPERWQVVVFKNPSAANHEYDGDPTENYIKRLVGMPNENLQILRGNVFTQPNDQPDQPWQIQTKPDHIQRVVWQPIYHSQYVPLKPSDTWQSPWQTDSPHAIHSTDHGKTYQYSAPAPATLAFAFDQRTERDFCAYNMTKHSFFGSYYVEDLAVSVDLRPESQGAAAAINMDTEFYEVQAGIESDGTSFLRIKPTGQDQYQDVGVALRNTVPLKQNQTTRLELWHVDQNITLFVNGKRVIEYQVPFYNRTDQLPADRFALSFEQMQQHHKPAVAPSASITVSGAPMTLQHLNLDRDIYYTPSLRPKGDDYPNAISQPIAIGNKEYFCCGDNSPLSSDSRAWNHTHALVKKLTPEHTRPGADQPGIRNGLVPAKLMIGRAFFVYFPAPLKYSDKGRIPVPNFGELRFIQ